MLSSGERSFEQTDEFMQKKSAFIFSVVTSCQKRRFRREPQAFTRRVLKIPPKLGISMFPPLAVL